MKMGNSDQSAIATSGPAWLAGAIGHAMRWALLPAAAVGTIVGVGIATGGVGSSAVMAALADPLSVLAARSPGARPAGALTQTKVRKSGLEDRTLANALTRPLDRFAAPGLGGTTPGTATGPLNDTVADAVTDAVAPAPAGDAVAPGPVLGSFIGTPGGIVVTPGIGGSTGGGGGSGGGGSGGGGGTETTPTTPVVTPTSPPVVASVPEPETWFTMLFGFGVIGGALRVRRRQAIGTLARATSVHPASIG